MVILRRSKERPLGCQSPPLSQHGIHQAAADRLADVLTQPKSPTNADPPEGRVRCLAQKSNAVETRPTMMSEADNPRTSEL